MHWTAGFRLGFILNVTGPPPVMCIVMHRLILIVPLLLAGCVQPKPVAYPNINRVLAEPAVSGTNQERRK
jgi:hypothetical protein